MTGVISVARVQRWAPGQGKKHLERPSRRVRPCSGRKHFRVPGHSSGSIRGNSKISQFTIRPSCMRGLFLFLSGCFDLDRIGCILGCKEYEMDRLIPMLVVLPLFVFWAWMFWDL